MQKVRLEISYYLHVHISFKFSFDKKYNLVLTSNSLIKKNKIRSLKRANIFITNNKIFRYASGINK